MTPLINDKEYDNLESSSYSVISNKTFDLTVRLFNIWIEIDYFEKQLKSLLQNHQELVDKFIEETTENAMIMPNLIAEFISKSKKVRNILSSIPKIGELRHKYSFEKF